MRRHDCKRKTFCNYFGIKQFLRFFKVMRSSDLSSFESVCFDREIEVEPQKLII